MSHAYIHGDILASCRGFAAVSSGRIWRDAYDRRTCTRRKECKRV